VCADLHVWDFRSKIKGSVWQWGDAVCCSLHVFCCRRSGPPLTVTYPSAFFCAPLNPGSPIISRRNWQPTNPTISRTMTHFREARGLGSNRKICSSFGWQRFSFFTKREAREALQHPRSWNRLPAVLFCSNSSPRIIHLTGGPLRLNCDAWQNTNILPQDVSIPFSSFWPMCTKRREACKEDHTHTVMGSALSCALSRGHTRFEKWISRTLNQFTWPKMFWKSRCGHEKVREFSV